MTTLKHPIKTALILAGLLSIGIAACQKVDPSDPNLPLDYALQDIPDIHDVIPIDLLEAIGENHLHFGDNPPSLMKDSLGFARKPSIVLNYIKADPNSNYEIIVGEPKQYTTYFRFYDQHRGVAKYDYKCVHIDTIYGGVFHQYVIEFANVADSVFIMGEKPYFTAYLTQNRHKENNVSTIVDNGSHEYVVLSGEVTETGIKNLYFGLKIKGYDNPISAGIDCLNIDDIVVFYIEFLPFKYWNPNQHYN
jgi:hypothetical protein